MNGETSSPRLVDKVQTVAVNSVDALERERMRRTLILYFTACPPKTMKSSPSRLAGKSSAAASAETR